MPLAIEKYNAAERHAIETKPNRITEACRPELFLKAGYPVEATTEAGLARFVDVMHENRDAADYKELLAGFTAEEFDLFKEVTQKVVEFTKERFGRSIVPKGALTRAMLSYRHIRMLAEPGATIFEVGPGSGYLGALLATSGYKYAAMDITQGFYLYQSHLWEYLFKDRFIELADRDQEFVGFGDLPSGCVLHVPWWKYTVIEPGQIDTSVDMYVANHALCEMNLYAMCYTMRLAHQLLSKSSSTGMFFVEGTGGEMLRSRAATFNFFSTVGFSRLFDDGGLIDVLVPTSRAKYFALQQSLPPENAPAKVEAPPPAAPPKFDLASVGAIIRRNGGVVRTSIKAIRYMLRTRNLPTTQAVQSAVVQSSVPLASANSINLRIEKGRAEIAGRPKVAFEDVRRFQRGLVPGGDVRSDDELFFQYVFGTDFYS